ncbi:MAG: phenylacetate-CoA oxygenase subunit PaaI [Deltaproteobacteria bacterium]|nr:phenylacetate-CoA oxygenase subunit PaaI [Deltaproteobacteria bacterium]
MARIATFDDWIDLFRSWLKEIGYEEARLGDYLFEAKFEDASSAEIEFGRYAGRPRWERVAELPNDAVRELLLKLIVYQGDTEFASVEQQRRLVATAPSPGDLESLVRVNREEMRHGWQMAYLLVTYFGDEGRKEAEGLLQRRADARTRLLGSFNEPVEDWLDFFAFTEFIDRDGKYQLTMLSRSAFAPLARSMGPMLKEEAYHLLTGHMGLMRVLKAGKVPVAILQKYLNRWISTALDLFGKDASTAAQRAYEAGLKGRFDEGARPGPADPLHLNERARSQYYEECKGLIELLNQWGPEGQPKLRAPDLRFNRRIGQHAGQPYSVDGELLDPGEHARHRAAALPGPEDRRAVASIFAEGRWVR